MNRRGFFSFLAAAPVGAAAAVATFKAEAAPAQIAPNVLRADPTGHRCGCGSPVHHFTVVSDVLSDPCHTHSLTPHMASRAQAVCSWCNHPWGGPTT